MHKEKHMIDWQKLQSNVQVRTCPRPLYVLMLCTISDGSSVSCPLAPRVSWDEWCWGEANTKLGGVSLSRMHYISEARRLHDDWCFHMMVFIDRLWEDVLFSASASRNSIHGITALECLTSVKAASAHKIGASGLERLEWR